MTTTLPPKVSIGLPVRNGDRYLEEALASLVGQDYPNLEIVISDNASTDRTKEILEDFRSRYPFIVVHTQSETLEATDNFTFVLEKATGEYFCWHAHDDLRGPGNVRALASVLDANPGIVCVMSDVVNFGESAVAGQVDRLEQIRVEKVVDSWKEVRRAFFAVPTTNIFFCVYGLYRTDVLRSVRMKQNLGFSANTEIPMLAQVALAGGIASVPDESFHYRRHEESIYHLEVAKESRFAPFRRRSAIRRVLVRLLRDTESLSAGERSILRRDLFASAARDRVRWISMAWRIGRNRVKWLAKRGIAKMKRLSIRRTLARVKGRLLGRSGAAPAANREAAIPPAVAEELKRLRAAERKRARIEERELKDANPKRYRLIEDLSIDCLLDCGANQGQFVETLHKSGWSGRVHSFEPQSAAFAGLQKRASGNSAWSVHRIALGAENGETTIRLAGNSLSSSLLEFSPEFVELRPDAGPVGEEVVTVRRLDDYLRESGIELSGRVMLKLDVQGFEISVLEGAVHSLDHVALIQCELALVPSYIGAPTFVETRDYLKKRGFVLAHLMDGHSDHLTYELREIDGMFVNPRFLKPAAETKDGAAPLA